MGLLSRAARQTGTITLADMDKSLVNAAARRGIESSIDPRMIMAGGTVGMAPAGAATAAALEAFQPYEAQAQREAFEQRRQRLLNTALQLRMRGVSSRDVGDNPDLQSALLMLEQQAMMPNDMQAMLEPHASSDGLREGAYSGWPGFEPASQRR